MGLHTTVKAIAAKMLTIVAVVRFARAPPTARVMLMLALRTKFAIVGRFELFRLFCLDFPVDFIMINTLSIFYNLYSILF